MGLLVRLIKCQRHRRMKSLISYPKSALLTVIAACLLWLYTMTILAPASAATAPLEVNSTGHSRVLWSWNYGNDSFRFVDIGQRIVVQRSNGDIGRILRLSVRLPRQASDPVGLLVLCRAGIKALKPKGRSAQPGCFSGPKSSAFRPLSSRTVRRLRRCCN